MLNDGLTAPVVAVLAIPMSVVGGVPVGMTGRDLLGIVVAVLPPDMAAGTVIIIGLSMILVVGVVRCASR